MINLLSNQLLKNYIRFFLFVFILFIPMKTSIYQISFGLLILFSSLYFLKNGQLTYLWQLLLQNKKVAISINLVIASMIISNLISSYSTLDSWKIIIHYIFRYFLFFLLLQALYEKSIISKHFIFIAIFSSLFLQGFDAIYQALTGFDFIRNLPGSINNGLQAATFNRNTFGLFMAIGISLSTAFLIKKELLPYFYYKVFFIFATALFLFGLMFSYSRAAWIFYCIFIFTFTIQEYKNFTNKNFIFYAIICFCILSFFFYFDSLFIRLLELVNLESSNRYTIWLDSINLIKIQPFFGYGLMTYPKITSQEILSVHNSLLEITLFLGIVGLTAFSFLLFLILQKIIQTKNSIYFAFFISFLIISQFDHSIIKNIPLLSTLSIFAFFIFSNQSLQKLSLNNKLNICHSTNKDK